MPVLSPFTLSMLTSSCEGSNTVVFPKASATRNPRAVSSPARSAIEGSAGTAEGRRRDSSSCKRRRSLARDDACGLCGLCGLTAEPSANAAAAQAALLAEALVQAAAEAAVG